MVTKITDSAGTEHDIRDSRVQNATAQNVGMIKPDGTTTTVDNDGTLHASSNPFTTDSSGYICYG